MHTLRRAATVSIFAVLVSFIPAVGRADPQHRRCGDSAVRCLIRKYWDGDDRLGLRIAGCEHAGRRQEHRRRLGSIQGARFAAVGFEPLVLELVRDRTFRAERWCSRCGLRSVNRRLFKRGADGRYICIDEARCASRIATSSA